MLLYAMYEWLRKTRRGRIEAQRKRACMVILTIVSLIVLGSDRPIVAVDSWIQLTEASATQTRAFVAPLLRAAYAPAP